jgi:hypothetical protein
MEYNIKNTGDITYLSELTQPFQQGSLRVGLRKGWVKFADGLTAYDLRHYVS